jgi:hypothetical protein
MIEIVCRGGETPQPLSDDELAGVRSSMWSHEANNLVPRLVATIDDLRRSFDHVLGVGEQSEHAQGPHRVESAHVTAAVRERVQRLTGISQPAGR